MFGFLRDIGTYESRKVGREDFSWGFVSTAEVSNGSLPYETAVQSDEYAPPNDLTNTDKTIIVEAYDTKEEALAGHQRWVDIMTNNPPDELIDCLNADVAQLGDLLGCNNKEVRIVDRPSLK